MTLSLREKLFGIHHPDVVYTLSSLGAIYSDQSKYEQAQNLYQRAISILEKTLGPEHMHLARVLTSYAELLRLTGFTQEAMELETRARGIFTRIRET